MGNHSDKTILVTGATGQQGSAVTRHLLKNGWKVNSGSLMKSLKIGDREHFK